jgi:methylated-DNA-[protein]-cysteine S-methyltransferase
MNELEDILRAAATALPEDPPPVAALAERAARSGLLDVAYAELDSPLGPLLVAVTDRGLVRVAYDAEHGDAVIEDLARRVSPRVLEARGKLDPVARELDEYFEGRRRGFDFPVDWTLAQGFTRRVLQATAKIPFGEVATYKDVAGHAGSPRGYRAAGNALGANPIPIVVPCHRVVASGGKLGGYTGGIERKLKLLAVEGR